jgi:inner membrane protein
VGYATHALLDACTTYGTLLCWPFSHFRVSWGFISVVNLAFTLPLLLGIALGLRKRSTRWVGAGLALAGSYLAATVVQQHRAVAAQRAIAERRGHAIDRGDVLPALLTSVTWRSIYQSDGRYFVDKIRVPWFGQSCVSEGSQAPVPTRRQAPPEASAEVQRAVRLIFWFASGWVAHAPSDASVLGDLRYSFSPTEIEPIWGVRVDDSWQHADWVNNRAKRGITWSHLSSLWFEDASDAICF